MRSALLAALASASLGLTACGGGGSGSAAPAPAPSPAPPATPAPAGPTITIQGLRFSPLSLQVAPGTTVTVRNLDSMAHSVTSQAAPGVFSPGAVAGVSFDTGPFLGTTTFTVPASAPVGSTVPYYCSTHLSTMATPNGELRIVTEPGTQVEPPSLPSTPY